jgi:glycosyltransferase involved in cell wall biosynthesis
MAKSGEANYRLDASVLNEHSLKNEPRAISVLQLITGLGVGGAERVVMELAGQLPDLGVKATVVVLSSNRAMLEQYNNPNFRVHFIGMKRNPWSLIKALNELSRIVREEGIDLIHAHMFHSVILGMLCKGLQPNIKLVFTSHTTGFSKLRQILIRIFRKYRNADVVFFEGQHAVMNTTNTIVIPNGVPVHPQKQIRSVIGGSRPVFLFAGRLEPEKDPVALIRGFSAMSNKDCELWFVGDGVLRSTVEQEIKTLGISDRVQLLGIRNDVPELLRQVDCFVMSSRWEGLPMAMLEAGAEGLPVIATPVGAIPALLGEDCGYLVDVSELHNALDQVLDNYPDAAVRGERLRQKVVNAYSLEHMSYSHAELYKKIISK